MQPQQPAQITVTGPVTVHVHFTTLQTDPAAIVGPIIAAIAATKGEIVNDFHTELDAQLAAIQAAEAAELTDLTRELADFAANVAPKLTTDESNQLAAILQSAKDRDAAIVAADPAPVAASPVAAGDGSSDAAAGDSTVDGSADAPAGDQSV